MPPVDGAAPLAMSPLPVKEQFIPKRLSVVIALLAVAFLCWYGAKRLDAIILHDRKYWPVVQDRVLLPPPSIVRWLALDYREVAADLLWIWVIQYYTSQHIGATGTSDLRFLRDFIDNIIALDPRFRRIYAWAANTVTYIHGRATQEEFHQSLHYLEKGIAQFPDDYDFLHRAGMRYYLDLWDPDPDKVKRWRKRGAELIEAAIRKPGAPPDAATLAANVLSEVGKRERALKLLRRMLLTTDNQEAQKKILARLRFMTDNDAVLEEVEVFRKKFTKSWQETLPFAKSTFYVILGDKPSPTIDLEDPSTALLFSMDDATELGPAN